MTKPRLTFAATARSLFPVAVLPAPLRCTLAALLIATATPLTASPWIDAGDEQTRHHLQNLVDSGAINVPLSTWPLMWSAVKSQLDPLKPAYLNPSQQWSYLYLRHELRKAMEKTSYEKHLHMSNATGTIGQFGSDARDRQELSLTINYQEQNIALRLNPNVTPDAMDGRELHLDGSFASILLGNWALGIGAIDRWWGPGWESSTILTHAARPVPGVFLQRNHAAPFETPLLSWLGPWQLVTFMGQLESHRAVESPYLWGMRLNLRPLRSLEIGLSRTAMWGGEGRPNDLDTFGKLLVGNDNRGDAGIDPLGLNEPGNQLAGVDLRWSWLAGPVATAFYAQLTGEDEAGMAPSRHIGLGGVELSTMLGEVNLRLSLEGQNSTVNFNDSQKKAANVAYEHSIYQSGYRYRGRPLAAFTDNDSEATTLRAQLYFRSGNSLELSYGRLDINTDGSGQNVFGPGRVKTDRISVEFSIPVSKKTAIQIGLNHFSEPVEFADQIIESSASLDAFLYW